MSLHCDAICGEGPRGSNGACPTLCRISVTPSTTHSRPLWVSPTTSPVRLGVSPAAAPTPTGIFNQRFEALFPPSWSPGLRGLLCSPPMVPVYLCVNVGLQGLPVVRLPAPVVPHSASLGPATTTGVLSILLRPGCPSPPFLPVWMNVYFLFPWCRTSLPFDFLSVLVVRGGSVCLPMPPSWFSLISIF